jgi:hypothetical protein
MDIEFPKPANPDLILDNSGAALDAGAAAATIRNRLAIADG